MWRSLVAYTAGGRVVAGSNPATPTKVHSTQLQIVVNTMEMSKLEVFEEL